MVLKKRRNIKIYKKDTKNVREFKKRLAKRDNIKLFKEEE